MKRSARWWVSPVVGGLAFAVVVLGVVAVGRAVPSAPSVPALPAASAPIQKGVPPYYVAIITDRPLSQYGLPASVASVRDTASGKVLATVRPPSAQDVSTTRRPPRHRPGPRMGNGSLSR